MQVSIQKYIFLGAIFLAKNLVAGYDQYQLSIEQKLLILAEKRVNRIIEESRLRQKRNNIKYYNPKKLREERRVLLGRAEQKQCFSSAEQVASVDRLSKPKNYNKNN